MREEIGDRKTKMNVEERRDQDTGIEWGRGGREKQ